MKAMGFGDGFVAFLIFGESSASPLLGGAAGDPVTFPIADVFGHAMGTLFPVFFVSRATVLMQLGAAVIVGVVAALRARAGGPRRVRIVDGLRATA